MTTSNIVLLGDSIFDNGAYVGRGPDVITQLRSILPGGWSATLVALDGSVTGDVVGQVGRIPQAATHLVVSAGGNDALSQSGVLQERVGSVAEALGELADLRSDFQGNYRRMLEALTSTEKPVAVCTVYDPCIDGPPRK
jgi:lysophospholipase L1-like esterase